MKSWSLLIKVYEHKCLIDWGRPAQLDFTNLLDSVVACLRRISTKRLMSSDWLKPPNTSAFNTNSRLWTTGFIFLSSWLPGCFSFSPQPGMGGRTASDGINRLFWQFDQKRTQSDAMKRRGTNQRKPGMRNNVFLQHVLLQVVWFNLAHGTISLYTSGIHK